MVADSSMPEMSSAFLSHPYGGKGGGCPSLEYSPGPKMVFSVSPVEGGKCIVCGGSLLGGLAPDSCAVSFLGCSCRSVGTGPAAGGCGRQGVCPLIWHIREMVPTNLEFSGSGAH